MAKNTVVFVLFGVMFSFAASAAVTQISLPAPLPKAPARLTAMKTAEDQEKWAVCAVAGARNFAADNDLKGWILSSWLRCARKAEAKGAATSLSRAALAAYDTAGVLRGSGPWQRALRQEHAKIRTQVIEREMSKNAAALAKDLDALLESLEPGDKDERARALALYAEWAQGQRDVDAAKIFYEESLGEKENRSVRDKYAQVLLALNQKNPEKNETGPEEFVADSERKFEDRFANAQKNNDLVALVEDCVSYLNKYPHGKRAKWANDKAIELYLMFFEESAGGAEKWVALRERTITVLEKAEWSRLGEWARTLHRRSDYAGSLRLAERALGSSGNSLWSGIILYVAGRSAELMGDDQKAQTYFERYAEAHSAGDEIAEVLFRLGLTHLRRNQAPSAVAVFERLLSMRNKDRYDLNARYWMVRALEAAKNPRAAKEADAIVQKFPFSYYGLKLRAEANQGILEWPSPLENAPAMKGKIALTGPQKKSWDRIRLLSAAGWRAEAMQEIGSFPNPEDVRLKALLARSWSQAQAYPAVIKLMNEASDDAPDLRARDLIGLGLPKDFQLIVEGEAKKNGLQPILVWSLMRQESAFNPKAVSSSNALGLMQLIPPTAKDVAQTLKLGPLDLPDDAFNPERNIPMGTSYLSQMIKLFENSVPLGLAAYNAGPTRMTAFVKSRPALSAQIIKAPDTALDEMWIDELPWFETSFYVKAILRNTLMYRLLDQRRVNVEMSVWKDLLQNPVSAASGPASAMIPH